MRNFFLLVIFSWMLSGCLGDIVFGGGKLSPPHAEASQQPRPMIDPYTGEEIKMWVPKGASINATWPFQARGEEDRCSRGYYRGKNDTKLLPSQREIYKKLSNGGWIWAYYYYYGEDTPGFDVTDWYETVFNIYVKPDGTIYGCAWKKYPLGWVNKHGTADGIEATVQSPR